VRKVADAHRTFLEAVVQVRLRAGREGAAAGFSQAARPLPSLLSTLRAAIFGGFDELIARAEEPRIFAVEILEIRAKPLLD
jgi:hypothetical protein